LVWFGLVWFGWFGLVGLVWFGLVGLVWFGLVMVVEVAVVVVVVDTDMVGAICAAAIVVLALTLAVLSAWL
jgi:hypothetical protein